MSERKRNWFITVDGGSVYRHHLRGSKRDALFAAGSLAALRFPRGRSVFFCIGNKSDHVKDPGATCWWGRSGEFRLGKR